MVEKVAEVQLVVAAIANKAGWPKVHLGKASYVQAVQEEKASNLQKNTRYCCGAIAKLRGRPEAGHP